MQALRQTRLMEGNRASAAWTGGFTLVELLVVIAIIALLLALLVPSYSKAHKQARAVLCLSNQRQIGLAMYAYAQDYDGSFPIAQYFDTAHSAFVCWDTITYAGDLHNAKPGLIWQYAVGGKVQQCPSYVGGQSNTPGDRYTGYNYNTTYIGRGENEIAYQGMGEAPAKVSEVRYATRAALVGDGGYIAGANKYMRAPFDAIGEATVHAGGQAFRHVDQTNVVYVDGHGSPTRRRYRKPGAHPHNERRLDWPKNGFLSPDDTAYAHR